MRRALRENYLPFSHVDIPLDPTMSALLKDKKNSSTELGLILPVGDAASIERVMISPDQQFVSQLRESLAELA
jgi:hypothetical protein